MVSLELGRDLIDGCFRHRRWGHVPGVWVMHHEHPMIKEVVKEVNMGSEEFRRWRVWCLLTDKFERNEESEPYYRQFRNSMPPELTDEYCWGIFVAYVRAMDPRS